jgi:hypothetical protein
MLLYSSKEISTILFRYGVFMRMLPRSTFYLSLFLSLVVLVGSSHAESVVAKKLSTRRNVVVLNGTKVRFVSISKKVSKNSKTITLSVQQKKKKAKRYALTSGYGRKRIALASAGTLDLVSSGSTLTDSKVIVTATVQPQSFCTPTGLNYELLESMCNSYVPAPQAVSSIPQPVNIDFGLWIGWCSQQVGAAAVGAPSDYWNTIGIPWCDDHTREGLRNVDGTASPIGVRLYNLGGGWASSGSVTSEGVLTDWRTPGKLDLKGTPYGLGVLDPMLDSYGYPQGNQAGSSVITLFNVPKGSYTLYLYGKTNIASLYGYYSVKVGSRDYGRRATSSEPESQYAKSWQEGNQYVSFSIVVDAGESVTIDVLPGGKPFFNPLINGLQLVPVL